MSIYVMRINLQWGYTDYMMQLFLQENYQEVKAPQSSYLSHRSEIKGVGICDELYL